MRTRARSRTMLAAAAAGLLALVAACGSGGSAGGQPVDVAVGTLRSLSDAPIYVALDKGYFSARGLKVDNVTFKNGAEMVAPLASGQLEVAAGAPSAGLFNALGQGLGMKIVGDKGRIGADSDFVAFLARPQLVDSGALRGYADLKGKRIGLSSKSASNFVQLVKALQSVGLTTADVQISEIDFPSMGTALANGSIDVALAPEPFVTAFVAQHLAVRWKGVNEVVPGQEAGVLLYNGQFAGDTDVATRFMAGYLEGVRDYREAFFGDRANRAEVIDILTRYTSVTDKVMYDTIVPAGVAADGLVNVDALAADAAVYQAAGLIRQPFDPATAVDDSFARAAAGGPTG